MIRKKNELDANNFYEEEDEIDLMDILFTFLRRWRLIVLIAIPIFGLGIFFAITRPTIYEANMTLMVSSGRNFSANSLDGGELTVNQKLATTYAEIAKNKAILNSVIKKYDLSINLEGLQGNLSIAPVRDTELLQLTYKNGDAALAAAVVNEIGNEFMLKVREVMNFQNIKVVELAEIPREALPKKRSIILVGSFILSLMVGAMVAFIVEFFFCKLRKSKDIEMILQTTMLGMVPDFNNSLENGGKDGQ